MDSRDLIKAFRGKIVGTNRTKLLLAQTLLKLPKNIITRLTKSVWFLSSVSDAWAYTFRGDDLKNHHMIFLSDEFLSQDKSQIEFTILHEVGHVILNHRNAINYRQTHHEIRTQELEADQFAYKYLD